MPTSIPFAPPYLYSTLSLSLMVAFPAIAEDQPSGVYTLETTTVTSSFRDDSLQETAASVSVIDEADLNKPGNTHLADVLALAPNVNVSAGASRGKYYQIRGVGERSQFIGAVNPSVGVLVDGIDMSSATLGATLLDAKQVEVLRGPQSSLYGANALAGLINISANEPTEYLTGDLELTVAQDNTQNLAAAVGGPISDKVSYRFAAQHNSSDGVTKNDYLKRDDTNNIDETLLRTKFHIEASDDLDLDLSAFYANVDNGYDVFSLKNDRHSLADNPGHDRQETVALSGKSTWYGNRHFIQETAISVNKNKMEYGFDEDWIYRGFHPDEYSSFDNYQRDEKGATVDVRFISTEASRLFNDSTAWTGGLYYFHRSSDLTRERTGKPTFSSEYEANRYAGYGELSTELTDKLIWINGLRLEEDHTLYSDSDGHQAKPTELLWGGRMALEYQTSDSQMLYGLISRGYKVGGYNSTNSLPEALRSFDSETLWNYELGAKHNLLDDTLHTQVAVFFQQRDNAQIKGSRIIGLGDFVDYTANADSAYSYGLEAQAQWKVSNAVQLYGSLGLLQTKLKESGAKFDGRDAAHAPEYQFSFGVNFDHGSGWFSGLDVEGKDEFYYSDSHNASSDTYTLLNARFGYELDNWTVTLWGKNLTDEEYGVRGFEFGNDPRNGYTTDEFVQLGAPRMFGVTTHYAF